MQNSAHLNVSLIQGGKSSNDLRRSSILPLSVQEVLEASSFILAIGDRLSVVVPERASRSVPSGTRATMLNKLWFRHGPITTRQLWPMTIVVQGSLSVIMADTCGMSSSFSLGIWNTARSLRLDACRQADQYCLRSTGRQTGRWAPRSSFRPRLIL